MPNEDGINPNENKEESISAIMKVFENIKTYITSTYNIFFPRIVIIFLVWIIFRILLYVLSLVADSFSFLPYFTEVNINTVYFLTTLIDLWLIACLIGFLVFIGYRIFQEIKKG